MFSRFTRYSHRLVLQPPLHKYLHSFINPTILESAHQNILKLTESAWNPSISNASSDFYIKNNRWIINKKDNQILLDIQVLGRNSNTLNTSLSLLEIRIQNMTGQIGFLFECIKSKQRFIYIKSNATSVTTIEVLLPPSLYILDFQWGYSNTLFLLISSDQIRPNTIVIYNIPIYLLQLKHQNNCLFLHKIQLHHIHTLITENDPTFFLSITLSNCYSKLLIHSHSKTYSEVRFLYLRTPYEVIMFHSREYGDRLSIQCIENTVYGVLQCNGSYQCIVRSTLNSGEKWEILRPNSLNSREKWEILWPKSDCEHTIEDIDICKNNLLIYGRINVKPLVLLIQFDLINNTYNIIYIINLIIKKAQKLFITLPCTFDIAPTIVHTNDDIIRLTISALTFTPIVIEIHINNNIIVKFPYSNIKIFGIIEQMEVNEIPITIVSSSIIQKNENNKILMIVYGAYGKNINISYSTYYHELLNRHWVIVFVHTRGGGEKGINWYNAGRGVNKLQTFLDFLIITNYLINQKYTNKSKLCIEGTSAGGLVLGYIANHFSYKYAGFLFKNAFLHPSDYSTPHALTQHEITEWGNYEISKQYCPMLNTIKCDKYYAPMYFVYGNSDIIVPPIDNTIKWVQLVHGKCNGPLIVRGIEGDHYGAYGVDRICYEAAVEVAFLEACVAVPK